MSLLRNMLFATVLFSFATPALAARGGGDKVDICHYAEGEGFFVINVSTNAVSAHFGNHGDSYPSLYFFDADGDTFGDPNGATDVCPNIGFVADNTDCDDADPAVNPAAEEIPYDGVDNDCAEGTPDDDLDNDGFGIADDCDDLDAAINPAAEEACADGIDNNCSGEIDENCAGDCPCFTVEDITNALSEWALTSYDYEYENCYDYDDNYSWDETWLDFGGYSYDAVTYEEEWNYYYSYGYDYYYDYNYCGTYNYDYYYNYETGEYTNDWYDNYLYITAAEMDACQAVIWDGAAAAGVACYQY